MSDHQPAAVRIVQALIFCGLGAFVGWGGTGDAQGAAAGAAVALCVVPIIDWWTGAFR